MLKQKKRNKKKERKTKIANILIKMELLIDMSQAIVEPKRFLKKTIIIKRIFLKKTIIIKRIFL